MNKIKIALAGMCALSMLGLLTVANIAGASTPGTLKYVASQPPAQVATATPDAGMMMEHATSTPEASMMMHEPLPATGAGTDSSGLLLLVAGAAVLLLSGIGLRKVMVGRK